MFSSYLLEFGEEKVSFYLNFLKIHCIIVDIRSRTVMCKMWLLGLKTVECKTLVSCNSYKTIGIGGFTCLFTSTVNHS